MFGSHSARLAELWRYYNVGLINTAFGYGLYALLVYLGLNLYVAQILSHVTGTTFNYFMFRQHVFKNTEHARVRYILAYAFNYVIGLISLTIMHHFVKSAYAAGFLALIAVSVINYFVLKAFVFRTKQAPP